MQVASDEQPTEIAAFELRIADLKIRQQDDALTERPGNCIRLCMKKNAFWRISYADIDIWREIHK